MNKHSEIDEKLYRQLVREGMDMVAVLDAQGTYKFVSPSYKSILGYEADELLGKNAFELIHPEETEQIFEEYLFFKTSKKEKSSPYRFRKKDGSYIWLQSFGTNLLDDPAVSGIVVHSIDATETYYYSRIDNLERKVLEMNSAGEGLESLLNAYVEGIEEIHPGMLCSVMKAEGNQLFNLVSPNLPKGYLKAVEGIEIGENQGACGTAAYLGKKVIISHAETDERTSKFLGLVEKYQFKALWSYPVKDENQQVVATFAAYYHEPRNPGEYEEKTVERAASLLQVILKNQRTLQALNKSNERFKYINMATEEVIYDHDLEGDEIMLSENFEKIFGYTFADEEFTLEKWATFVHPDDRDEINQRLEAALKDRNTNRWNAEFRYKRKDGTYAHVVENSYILRDKSGKAVRMIGAVRDVSDRKNREVKQKLITEVSRIFTETEGVRESLKKALNKFNELGNFELAEVWLTGYDKKRIDLVAALDKEVKQFYNSDDGVVSVKPGKGLPGKTWKSGKVQFWKNLDKRKSFLRRKAAEKAGLKTAYGIPITNKDEVIGVLVLGVKGNVKKADSYASILEELAVHLGEEIKRKELEEELARLFISAPDGIVIAGFDGFFKKVNPAMCEMLGYTESELLSIPFLELLHPDDKEDTLKQFEAIEQRGENHFYENRYITKSGKILWLAWSSKLFLDEEVAYSVVKNVTKEKELKHLHEQATKLARIGSWEVDLIENKIYWSDITREILGVGADTEPSMEKGLDLYKEGESRDKMSNAILKAIENGTPWDIEVQTVIEQSKEKWVRSIGNAELIDGKCVRLYGSLQDIHEKKELEELLENATRLAKIGSWEVDLVEEKMYWSDVTREIHEVDPDYKPDLESAVHFYKEGESREKISDAIDKAVETGSPFDLELQIVTANGNEKWIRAIGEAELIEGKCVRLYGSFQDIHQRKSAEISQQKAFEERNEILESIGDAFFAVDHNWVVTYWNHMAEEVLGMPREKILGENLWDLYEDATSLEFYTQYHKAVNEQVTVHFEEYYPTLDQWFEVSAYPSSSGLSVYFKDISVRKRNQKKILEKTYQLDAIARFNSLLIKKEHWLEALDESLEMFGMVADTDRVYYFEHHQDGGSDQHVISMRAEWVRKGIKPELDNPVHHNLPLDDVKPITDVLTEKKAFNRVVKDIEDRDFRKFLQDQEIKSILAIPVFTGDLFHGFIGFDDCTKERTWSEEEITFLETISFNLASALENEDAEVALQLAYDEKNEILESIGDGFFAVDEDFTVNYWNSQAEELLFTPKEKVIGKNLWEIFDRDQAKESYRQYSKALKQRKALKFEDYYEPIDRWFDVNVYPSKNGISVFFKDITDRKESEKRLKLLESVITNTTESVIILEAEPTEFPNRRILYVNDAFSIETGYSIEEVAGKPLNFLYGPKSDIEKIREVLQSMADWEICSTEIITYKKDGTPFWVNISFVPVAGDDGNYTHWVAIAREISKRKEYELQLKDSLEEKKVLLSEIHHRVKNNLALVSSMIHLQAFEEENKEVVDKLLDSTFRIRTMATIHELLYQSDSFSKLAFTEIIDQLIESIDKVLSNEKNITYQIDSDDIELNINQAIPCSLIINEVVTNIYKHALHGRNKVKVDVQLKAEGDEVFLSISDNGCGLPEEFNYEESNSLGMNIIKILSNQLGGESDFTSSDEGTTFKLNFIKRVQAGIGSAKIQ